MQQESEHEDRTPMYVHGIASGLIGAVVVSALYLAIDVAAGHPLYTPNALGAALFRGQSLGPEAPIEMWLVFGYTAAHGAVFWAFGVMAAVGLWEGVRSLRSPLMGALVTAGLLFAGLEITFEIFGALFTPGVGGFGGGRAAVANALAALAMAGYLAAVRSLATSDGHRTIRGRA
jgi:hypothetical protein